MSYTYSSFVTALSTAVVIPSNDANFTAILPSCIDYAEQRIYRELNLIASQDATTGTLTSGNRNYTLPSTFVVVDQVNVVTPAGSTVTNGTRNALTFTSREFLDAAWSSSTGATVPRYYAMLSDDTIIVGPWPDASYGIEVVGIVRPTALSSGNTTTYLTTNLPDLFFAAAMVFMSGYMRNYGAQADDPKMAVSWETTYTTLLRSAKLEELRKRGKVVPGTTDEPTVGAGA